MGRENRREIVPRALSPPPVQTQRLSFLFSSALKNKETKCINLPNKKLKQLCQHYGVGSEHAPGEGGVER